MITNKNNQNISFKSNIKFISPLKFRKYHDKGYYIGFLHNQSNLIKGDNFYTEAIATCTGGGLVNPKNEAAGFHIWDDKVNLKNMHDILVKMFRVVKNPERALLIGSKEMNGSPYSLSIFSKFKEAFLKRIPNVTLFEKHLYRRSATNFHYSVKDDTWLISTLYIPEAEKLIVAPKHVKSLKTLREAFENIKIAKGDRLFVGNKEITPEIAPDLFG